MTVGRMDIGKRKSRRRIDCLKDGAIGLLGFAVVKYLPWWIGELLGHDRVLSGGAVGSIHGASLILATTK